MSILGTIEHDVDVVASHIKDGFVAVFHAVEHEVPMILATLVNVYGPHVVAEAIATHKASLTMYADKAIEIGEADAKALVQSTLVEKFGLPPTAAQFVFSAIHHLVTIGEDKINGLIEAGAAKAIAATGTTPSA